MLRDEAEHSAPSRQRAETGLLSPMLSSEWTPGGSRSVGLATQLRELSIPDVGVVVLADESR